MMFSTVGVAFDYQSVCHCSKTIASTNAAPVCLTTSQFVTAPKPRVYVDDASFV